MDRSVEVRLRMEISNFMRNASVAGRAVDELTARLAVLDAQVDALDSHIQQLSDSTQAAARRLRAQARAAELLNTNMGSLNGTMATHNSLLSANSQQTNAFVRNNNRASASINQLTGRLGVYADMALTLGPGLIPIGAVGAQAIGGLAMAALTAATAGASAVVAFQGLGDAVKAVQEYELDPTAASLEKAEEALAKMGPEARAFVAEFQRFRPVLTEIKRAAEAGWFPGLTESLEDFERLAPVIEKIFFQAGQAGGFLTEGIAESLASDRWRPFLDFIADEVPTAMGSLTDIMGSLTHGAAEMFMALDPGNDRFLAWLEDVARGFDNWASSAQGREDIEGFLAYARENGPAVADLFSSLVGALSAIVQAAAPLGGPVLQGLTAAAEVIEVIADSDMATPILAAVAALRVYNRMAALVTTTQGRLTTAFGRTAAVAPTANQSAAMAGLSPAMQAALLAPRASDAAAARRAMIAKGAGMAGLGGLLATGAASEVNLTNTAMLTLIGTLAGPWGAAAGAAAGFAMDAAAANNEFADSASAAQVAIDRMDFSAFSGALDDARVKQEELAERFETDGKNFGEQMLQGLDPGYWKNTFEGMFGDSDTDEAAAELERLNKAAYQSQASVAQLGRAMGMTIDPVDGSAKSIAELNNVLEFAKPAMDSLGITTEDLNRAFSDQAAIENTSDNLLPNLADALRGTVTPYDDLKRNIVDQMTFMDSAAGRTIALGTAMRGLSAELPVSEKAKALGEALDGLMDPAMNAEAATDAWRVSLQGLRKELDDDAGFKGFSEAAVANRELTRSYVDGVQQRLVAMVAAGAGEKRVAKAVQDSRQEFIASGIAAGFSAEAMRKRADAMGLTPKLVRTVFEATGLVESTLRAQETAALYRSLPRRVQTKVATDGVPKTLGELNRLDARFDLTARERRALIKLMDLASGPAGNLKAKLDKAAAPRTAKIQMTALGEEQIRAAKALMDSVQSKTVTLTVQRTAQRIAEGSYVSGGFTGPGGRHEPAGVVHRGEVVIPQDLVRRDWSMLSSRYGHLPGFAGGGVVTNLGVPGMNAPPPVGAIMSWGELLGQVNRELIRELKTKARLLEKELERDKRATDRERQELEAVKELRRSLAESVSGRFTESPWAAAADAAAGPFSVGGFGIVGANFGEQPEMTAEEARERLSLLATLRKRGLPAEVMMALATATLTELRGLVAYSDAELNSFEEDFAAGKLAQSSPSNTLRQQIEEAREFLRLIKSLEAQGLSGAALADAAQNASLQQLQALSSGGGAGVQEYTDLFNQRQEYADQAGNVVGGIVYDGQISAERADFKAALEEQRQTNQELKDVGKRLERLEERAEKAERQREREIGATVAAGERISRSIAGSAGSAGRGRMR